MNAPEDFLDQDQAELALIAEQIEDSTNGAVGRREFLFMSLVSAAASTLVPAFARGRSQRTPRVALSLPAPQQAVSHFLRTRSATANRPPSSSPYHTPAAPAR